MLTAQLQLETVYLSKPGLTSSRNKLTLQENLLNKNPYDDELQVAKCLNNGWRLKIVRTIIQRT